MPDGLLSLEKIASAYARYVRKALGLVLIALVYAVIDSPVRQSAIRCLVYAAFCCYLQPDRL